MFTGLIEALGTVAERTAVPGGFRLRVAAPSIEAEVCDGESISVNGVCLTVVEAGTGSLAFDLGPETARVTSLGRVRPGSRVNLERAMRADARMGGHFVQGHVDGTGVCAAVRAEAEFTWMTFTFPPDQAAYLVSKGAVAVDGISLTVARLGDTSFDVQIIPFTWMHTNLSALAVGDPVNLEFDMLGKYAVRAVELIAQRDAPTL